MSRLIDADALKAVFEEKSSEAVCGVELCKAIISRIDEAPAAQPEVAKDMNVPSTDCISREAAIDALRMDIDIIPYAKAREYVRAVIETVYNRLEHLPTAQPTQDFGRDTNVPSTDYISRQETIDAVNKALDRETIIYSFVRKVAIDSIKTLPAAQPEMVKCKKCRYVHYDEEFDNYWCNRMSGSFKVEADGYCKWGK